MSKTDIDDLAAELSDFAPEAKKSAVSAKDERIIAGFEEIQRFVDEHGRHPLHGEDRDIFERLYAVRLDRIRALPECRTLVASLDRQGLLTSVQSVAEPAAEESDQLSELDDLAAELSELEPSEDITVLRHVRSSADKRAAEEVASQTPCADFDNFRPLFEQVRIELDTGLRQAQPISANNRQIESGDFFVLDGVTLYVADVGPPIKMTAREQDSRLRVIFSNGTESNLLLRSLQRAFYNDPAARRLTSPKGEQFSLDGEWEADDVESGTIYVLRSLSEHPSIQQHRELIHKIGVTGGKVESRIANASKDATYLLADVKVVRTYKLVGINRNRMEKLFHRIFSPALLDLAIEDRFGNPVKPREWFMVPLEAIDEAVDRIRDRTILDYVYDPSAARLVLDRS